MPIDGVDDAPRIGLVLGGGAARGWAHLGAIEELEKMGITPDLISGCSIGSIVGAFYAAGKLQDLRDFADNLTMIDMVEFFDFTWKNGGLIGGGKVISWFQSHLDSPTIEGLEIPFAAVAADIRTGREVWLREGSLSDAMRASIAIPGLLTPWSAGGCWLSDGGLVNPLPISLARAMEADIVIAVDLNAGVFRDGGTQASELVPSSDEPQVLLHSWLDDLAEHLPKSLKETTRKMLRDLLRKRDRGPQQYEVISNAIAIMSDRITKSRLEGEPADVLLTPSLGEIGAMEFFKAADAIAAGAEAVKLMRPQIEAALGHSLPGPNTLGKSQEHTQIEGDGS